MTVPVPMGIVEHCALEPARAVPVQVPIVRTEVLDEVRFSR